MSTNGKPKSVSPTPVSMAGLVDEMVRIHEDTAHQSFVFLLGAGASVSSKIPPASVLARNWLIELHKQDPDVGTLGFDDWLKAGRHEVAGLDPTNLAAAYPAIFDRRFGSNPNHGYAALTKAMIGAEPGYGYSVLATMLSESRHNTVITTNFDNLVERALLYYTNHTPLTCTHETTAGIFRRGVSRPLIVKCHRDLLLDPHNGTEGTSKLHEKYGAAIKSLLPGKVLIVVGYGGNDGSLMDFLESLDADHVPDAVYWCYWKPDGPPMGRPASWIESRRGLVVPIDGFDELMYAVRKAFNYKLLDTEMDDLHARRKAEYRRQAEDIAKRLGDGPAAVPPDAPLSASTLPTPSASVDDPAVSLSAAVAPIFAAPTASPPIAKPKLPKRQSPRSSLDAVLPILEMTDRGEKETAFKAAMEEFPDDPEVLDRFATFLSEQGRFGEAKDFAQRALEIASTKYGDGSPEEGRFQNNFSLIQRKLGDFSGARASVERAIEVNSAHLAPDHPTLAINYCNLSLMQQDQGDLPGARASMEKAIAIESKHFTSDHPILAISYSILSRIQQDQGDLPGARGSIERSIQIDSKYLAPDNPNFADRYSNLAMIQCEQGDLPGARISMDKAIAIDSKHFTPDHPNFATWYSNLAMIQREEGDLPQARVNIDKAITIASKHFADDHPTLATNFSNLARIQQDQGDLPGARASIERSIEIDSKYFAPDHMYHAINSYKLGLIEAAEGNRKQACATFKKALALFRKQFKDDHYRVVRLLKAMKENGCTPEAP